MSNILGPNVTVTSDPVPGVTPGRSHSALGTPLLALYGLFGDGLQVGKRGVQDLLLLLYFQVVYVRQRRVCAPGAISIHEPQLGVEDGV